MRKNIILKDFNNIKGETDGKIENFCFRIVDHYGDDYFKLPNKKNHPCVEFKIRKSHNIGFSYYLGTILRTVLKEDNGFCLYRHTYDGYAQIEHKELKKSFLSVCKEMFNNKEIKQLMRNVA